MIGHLSGILSEKHAPSIVIDVGGVGYELDVSMQTFWALPAIGAPVRLYTQLIVREDAHLLFGFAQSDERAVFRQLLKVSGIGAKTALAVLSAMNPTELAQALAAEDVKKLTTLPGIGKKTAERMVLELRGKLAVSGMDAPLWAMPSGASAHDDVVSTLLALGYSDKEAQVAVKGLPEGVEVGEGVRLALKSLMK